MPRRPLTKPRKHATQARSRATVEALVDATARILVREGFDKASTNRIAEVAGVSVGSLYQYFPSKEAIVVAVARRHHDDLIQVVRGALARTTGQTLAQGVGALVAAAIEAHRVDPRLHRVLAEEIPRVGGLADAGSFNRDNHALFRAYLESHGDEIRVVDLDLATFMCVTTIEALTHTAVLHHAETFPDEAMEALAREATRLITGYLTG
jgi:AcrR family transcriptional regulator